MSVGKYRMSTNYTGRHANLMANVLNCGSKQPGVSPGRGHCVVFLCKTLHYHSASIHPDEQMGSGELNAGDNAVMG